MTDLRQHDESGLSLVEVLVASTVALIVLLAVSSTVYMAGKTTTTTIHQGSALPGGLFAAQDAQRALASAWDPHLGAVSGITNDCSTSAAGTTQFTDSGGTQGAFVSTATNEVAFCGFIPGSSVAYTYDLYLGPTNGCTSSCTLTLVQWPCAVSWDPSCSATSKSVKWAVSGISQGALNGTAFLYKKESGGSWSTQASPDHTTQVVELDLTAVNSSTNGPEIVRDVVLTGALKGMS